MAALFGNAGDNSRREPRSLLEFRAGKMKLSGTTVSADTRKGLVYVKMEDGLLHFCWKDRKNGEIVDVGLPQLIRIRDGKISLRHCRTSSYSLVMPN